MHTDPSTPSENTCIVCKPGLTVGELRRLLKQLPEDLPVYLSGEEGYGPYQPESLNIVSHRDCLGRNPNYRHGDPLPSRYLYSEAYSICLIQ